MKRQLLLLTTMFCLTLTVSAARATDFSKAGSVQNIPTMLGLPAGAKTPFVTLEAEWGELEKATVFRFKLPIPKVASFEIEASGAAYVRLAEEGASVSWQNPVARLNALNIRSCLPDMPDGGGMTGELGLYVDGEFRQNITLSSKQSWVYRTHDKGWIDDPKPGGMPFKFYNEDRARIKGEPVAKGSTITLRIQKGFRPGFCLLDCIDFESVGPPRAQPKNALSITDFGADPTGEEDSQVAIEACVEAAEKQGKTVWIPAGRFMTCNAKPGPLDLSGAIVEGAGMWHSMLYIKRPDPLPDNDGGKWRAKLTFTGKTVLRDFAIDSGAVRRGISENGGGDYACVGAGKGWLVERLWVQHCEPLWMTGSYGTVRDCRVADSWGDAINLNNSNRKRYRDGVLTSQGFYLSAVNNFVRGNGDDGIATYSDGGSDGMFNNTRMQGVTILNNTSVAPHWANTMRIAGGVDVEFKGNFCYGSAANNNLAIAVFGKNGNPLESAVVEDNVFLNGGGWNHHHQHGVSFGSHATIPTKVTFRNNIVMGSRNAAIMFSGKLDLVLEGNTIINPGRAVFAISENAQGSAVVRDLHLKGLTHGVEKVIDHSNGRFHLSGYEGDR